MSNENRLLVDSSAVDEWFSCFVDSERRQILGVLLVLENESVTVRDLGTYLVPRYNERPLDDEVTEQLEQARSRLYNIHLPKLEETGLITREGDVVRLSKNPFFEYELIHDVLEAELERKVE